MGYESSEIGLLCYGVELALGGQPAQRSLNNVRACYGVRAGAFRQVTAYLKRLQFSLNQIRFPLRAHYLSKIPFRLCVYKHGWRCA
jgi:hypothetical protein